MREAVTLENHGMRLFGVMHRPVGVEKYPAVLFCHGFAGNKVGLKRQFVEQAKLLAEQGIASFRVDYRGCGDSEGDQWEMRLSDNISDSLKAMEFLLNDKHVDSSRIGLLGRSMGAAVAIETAHAFPQVKSLNLWTPVAGSPKWMDRWQDFHSTFGQGDHVLVNRVPFRLDFVKGYFEDFFKVQPLSKLPALGHIPLMHVHAAKDAIVTSEHLSVYRELRGNAVAETLYMELEETDHNLFDPTDFQTLLKSSHEWFAKTL